jgi:hypothetical protein
MQTQHISESAKHTSALVDGKSIHFYNSLQEPLGCILKRDVDKLKPLSYGMRSHFLKSIWVPRSVQRAINRYLRS